VLVAHAYNPSNLRRQRSGGSWFEASSKILNTKRTGGEAQVVQYLPSKYETLSSNPINHKQQQKKQQ
jgi:hypothetical protein